MLRWEEELSTFPAKVVATSYLRSNGVNGMASIPISTLKQVIRYDAESGKLFWLERPLSMFHKTKNKSAEHVWKWWNNRFANKEAFTAKGVENCFAGRIFGVCHYAHRVAWALHFEDWPPIDIDHEDGDRSNNRITNLRLASHQENMQNKKLYRTNISGTHGVSFNSRSQKWQAYITVNKKREHLGYFGEMEMAVNARRDAEQSCGLFHQNHGRAG